MVSPESKDDPPTAIGPIYSSTYDGCWAGFAVRGQSLTIDSYLTLNSSTVGTVLHTGGTETRKPEQQCSPTGEDALFGGSGSLTNAVFCDTGLPVFIDRPFSAEGRIITPFERSLISDSRTCLR
jgi:hypothetical protein